MGRKKGKNRLVTIVLLGVLGVAIWGRYEIQSEEKHSSKKVFSIQVKEIHSNIDKDQDGMEDYTDFVEGARAYIKTKPNYKSGYYQGGYPTTGEGVCTDVICQGFQGAGYDLKKMVDADIVAHPQWYISIKIPDPNIDFRRVVNLKVFFQKNSESLTTKTTNPQMWQGGDVVVYKKHIAFCSNKRDAQGFPYIIHHDGKGAREADELRKQKVYGHYRWNK